MTGAQRQSGEPRKGGRGGTVAMWGAVVAACAVCCAGPLFAALAALGLAAGVAAVAVPALAVVAVAAFAAVWWLRRRAGADCETPTGDPVDLGLPTSAPPDERWPGPTRPAR